MTGKTMGSQGVRVLAIANQKGGVGRRRLQSSRTALAASGERVLVVDLDPQGNASTGLGISQNERVRTTYDVMTGQCAPARCRDQDAGAGSGHRACELRPGRMSQN